MLLGHLTFKVKYVAHLVNDLISALPEMRLWLLSFEKKKFAKYE